MDNFLFLLSGLKITVQLCTGILIGLTLAGASPARRLKWFFFISAAAGLSVSAMQQFLNPGIPAALGYLLVFPFLPLLLRISYRQSSIAMLLAMFYDLLIVSLVGYNLFDVMLVHNGISMDIGAQISIDLFISLTNIFIAIVLVSRSAALFPASLFELPLGYGRTGG